MELFEIHITGDENIISYSDHLGIKSITIDLLDQNKNPISREYMTSHTVKCKDYIACKNYVFNLLLRRLEDLYYDDDGLYESEIERVKIECPYYSHYSGDSLYMESHWNITNHSDILKYPISHNINKENILATDRMYNHNEYDNFRKKHNYHEIELCLYDNNIHWDKNWFDLWKN